MSNIRAGQQAPIFTTYAAPLERAGFIIDQGYVFEYDRSDRSVGFNTDMAGKWGVGFSDGERFVSQPKEFFRPPVITSSFPDLVTYECYPFEGIRVRGTFTPYHSQLALWEVELYNESAGNRNITVFPYWRNAYRYFRLPSQEEGGKIVRFYHEEFPDDWTRSHKQPFQDSLLNTLVFSDSLEAVAAFQSEAGEAPHQAPPIFTGRQPIRQLSGRLYLPGHKRWLNPPPVRFQLFPENNLNIMVTESAPLLGTYGPAISKDGYYRLEAGWAAPQADSFMLQVLAPSGPFHNTVKGSFTGASRQYTDLVMKPGVGPTPVTQFESIVSAEKGYTLSWTTYAGRYTYSIYRKKIADPFYRRVAKDLKTRSWTDSTAIADINYQYIICMHGWDGAIGLPSAAVQVGPAMQTVQSGASFHNWIQTGKTAGPALPDSAYIVAGRKRFQLAPGGMDRLAMAKLVSAPDRPLPGLLKEARFLMLTDWEGLKRDAHRKMLPAQRLALTDTLQTWVYQNAANLMAQSFLPPEGKSGFPYYVFSREPTWGWGHGGQVFHESLTMLAYAHIHPERAMASQRVFAERQHPDGYINYRTGPYLDETIETNGQPTLSAPWYAWTNWELYRITKDRKFLEEMYRSSVKLFEYILKNRDKDGDGLTEWGGHAVLESVRDGEVAVWDEVADPAELEALDMNCMLVQEARSLSQMAAELGLDGEATRWKQEADTRSRRINETFWDAATGFYYHVDKKRNTFKFKKDDDLKRAEIIGFLPLWAGIADAGQAGQLVTMLTDTAAFWRPYGVPTLSASDPYYDPQGYWNGPVWVQWNYLIVHGLLKYGYRKEARELASKLVSVMADRLKKDHTFWELYSPDQSWGGHHQTYIWAGIINQILWELEAD